MGTHTTQPIQIDAAGIYTDPLLVELLGVSPATLAEARRSGQLRYVRRGRQILHQGSWVRTWLGMDGPDAAVRR